MDKELSPQELNNLYAELEIFLQSSLFAHFYGCFRYSLGLLVNSLLEGNVDENVKERILGSSATIKDILAFFPNLFEEVKEKLNEQNNG